MRSSTLIIFLFPVVASLFFGTMVLGEIIKKPDRELNLWQFDSELSHTTQTDDIRISGLKSQYEKSENVEMRISILDTEFDCGDLYITIFDLNVLSKQVLSQNAFFEQCFRKTNSDLPINDKFSEKIENPGSYEIVVEMIDENFNDRIVHSEKFKVK